MNATLTFLTGSLRGHTADLGKNSVEIGRATNMDIVVPEADAEYVSRHHVTLEPSGSSWLVTDHGSTNGTFVNGARVSSQLLGNGDTLRLGKHLELRFEAADDRTRMADPDATRRAPDFDAPPPLPTPRASPERSRPVAGNVAGARPAPITSGKKSSSMVVGAVVLVVVAALGLGAVAWQSGLLARSPDDVFPRLAEEYEQSVFLVETGFTVGGDYVALNTGTAFAAADGGLLLTNKHVVQPHRYDLRAACWAEALRNVGINFADSLVITVWPGGSVFRQSTGQRGDQGLGYSTSTGSLELAELATDNSSRTGVFDCDLRESFLPPEGIQFQMRWSPHDQDNADLAVLRIDGNPKPFTLADAEPETDEPVMAFGFPRGYSVIESESADPVWRGGRVIRTQETIHTDAVVQGGNSGGPLVNLRGQVVGVTTRGTDDSQFNMALKIDYARILLQRAQ